MTRKMDFMPIGQYRTEEKASAHTASLNVKYGRVTFSEEYVREKGLSGSFLMFFYDRKAKAFGWRKVTGDELLAKGSKWPQVAKLGSAYCAFISRKKGGPIDGMGLDRTKSYRGQAVKTYGQSRLTGVIDYIELR